MREDGRVRAGEEIREGVVWYADSLKGGCQGVEGRMTRKKWEK